MPATKVPAREVPQARSLDTVRSVVDCARAAPANVNVIVQATMLSKRHAHYHLVAACTLGFLQPNGDAYSLTTKGRALLSTTTRSKDEAKIFYCALDESPLIRSVAPGLVANNREVALSELTRQISKLSGLAKSTAEARAATLVGWRKRIYQYLPAVDFPASMHLSVNDTQDAYRPPLHSDKTSSLSTELKRQFLERPESQYFDRKARNKDVAGVIATLVGFANSEGGELILGVHDTKRQGERLDGAESEELWNAVLNAAYFQVSPAISGLTYKLYQYRDSKSGHFRYLLHFDVPESSGVHYTPDQRCYLRKGAQTARVPDAQVPALLFEKGVISYEDTPVEDYAPQTLSGHSPAKKYFDRLGVSDPIRFLRSQRLSITQRTKDESVTSAAVLLFDVLPQASLPTKCAVKLTRLETTEPVYNRKWIVGDPMAIEGDVETLIYATVDEIRKIMGTVSFERAGELLRLDFPRDVLHELIANAILHRDYSIKDDVHVRIYNNRIEIQSPGKLPGPVTVSNLREQHYARNPKLVRLLNKLPSPPNRDIGEGIDTVINELRAAKLRDPEFIELSNGFLVVLRHEPNATPQERILEYLNAETDRTITNRIARDLTGIGSENAVKRIFSKMKNAEMIEVVDPSAGKQQTAYRVKRRKSRR